MRHSALNVLGIPVYVDLSGSMFWIDDRLLIADGMHITALRGMVNEYLKYVYLASGTGGFVNYASWTTEPLDQTPDSNGWRQIL
jgi:hypothetical protein